MRFQRTWNITFKTFDFFVYVFLQKTPLYFASGSGHVDVVQCLLESGANINSRKEDGVRCFCRKNKAESYLPILSSLIISAIGGVVCRKKCKLSKVTVKYRLIRLQVVSNVLKQKGI